MSADDYRIGTAAPQEAGSLYSLMRGVWEGLEDKSLFAVEDLDEDWVRRQLETGFGVTARTPDGTLAGMLMVCRYGRDAENLGFDLGYPPEALEQVCNLECAAVLPEHRGHGLESRMFAHAEALLRGTDVRLMAMTVSPDNPASLRSAERAGFRVALTKKKYGGLLRHVLIKPMPAAGEE